MSDQGTGKKINLVLGISTDDARQAMIDRLRDPVNAARKGDRCK